MKRALLAVAVLIIAQGVYAELAPGKTIEDYLPVISGNLMEDHGNGNTYRIGQLDEFEVEEGKYKFKGSFEQVTDIGTIVIEELEFDPDPSVFVNALVTNTTNSIQTYTFTMTQPAWLANMNNDIFGSIIVSLQDQDIPVDGATMADNNTAVYKAYIDGVEVATLMDTLSLSTALQAGDSAQFGWTPYVGAVTQDIRIDIEFTLTPGDSATVLSRFDVVVPEPATLSILGLGGLLMLRKKKH